VRKLVVASPISIARDLFPAVLAQNRVFAQIVQEEVNRWPVQAGAPLAFGLIEFDFDLTVLDGQLLLEKLADGFV
jgi:hypothetical protein